MMHGTGEGSTLEGSGTPSLLTAVWTYSWAVVIKYVIPPVLLLLLVKGIQVVMGRAYSLDPKRSPNRNPNWR